MFDITEEYVEAAPVIPFNPGNCTVVSLLPYPLKEPKPSIIPGYFQIPGSRHGIPALLPVGESIHWMESPFNDTPPIKMTHTPREVAASIVNDFVEAQLAIDSDALPGIFWIHGHKKIEQVLRENKEDLEKAKNNQDRWFINLVRIADDDWAKTHLHVSISDIQRYAGKALNLNREWLSATLSEIQLQCPLCKEYVRSDAIIHSACGFIMRPDEYKKMKADGLILEAVK